jgi:hypothetical protein
MQKEKLFQTNSNGFYLLLRPSCKTSPVVAEKFRNPGTAMFIILKEGCRKNMSLQEIV